MKKADDAIIRLFDEMLKIGLVSTGNMWIEIAVEQKSTKLPIAVAHSRLLVYDRIDKKILTLEKLN
jgi:hypothetical protein